MVFGQILKSCRSSSSNKADKDFAIRLDFKDIKFPVKTRDLHKIEKINSIGNNSFVYGNKVKYPIYVSKKYCEDKLVDLLLIAEREKAPCFYQRSQYIHV